MFSREVIQTSRLWNGLRCLEWIKDRNLRSAFSEVVKEATVFTSMVFGNKHFRGSHCGAKA